MKNESLGRYVQIQGYSTQVAAETSPNKNNKFSSIRA